MEEWKEYKLKDICQKITDGSHSSPKAQNEGYPMFSVKDMLEYGFDYSKCKLISYNDFISLKQNDCVPQKGDILVAKDGSYLKQIFVCKETKEEGILSSIAIFRPNSLVDSYFLCYLLKSPEVYNFISNNCVSGSALPRIVLKDFKEVSLKIPTLEIQKGIVNILKSLDDKIEINRRINDNFHLKLLLEALLIWWVSILINDNLEQHGKVLFEEYVMNSNKPYTHLLSDYALINPPRTITKGREARCIDMSSLPTKGTFPSDWTFKKYNGGMKFQNGDTIMARITPCLENGKTAYINFLDENEIAFGSTEYIVLSAQEGFCSELLYFLARNDDFISYAVAHMNGSSGRQRVSGNDIADYLMPDIANESLDSVNEKLHEIMEVIKNNSLESRHLAKIRDALLPRLMSGKLKISDLTL